MHNICPFGFAASVTSKGSDQGDLDIEFEMIIESHLDALDISSREKANNSNLHIIAYGNLFESEEDTTEDSPSECDQEVNQSQNLGRKTRRYKRQQYRANVQAKINKERSIVEWLSYVGACDAHRKLIDNWGEYLQSVMWCRTQPLDIAQLEIIEKPKLSCTAWRHQNKELA